MDQDELPATPAEAVVARMIGPEATAMRDETVRQLNELATFPDALYQGILRLLSRHEQDVLRCFVKTDWRRIDQLMETITPHVTNEPEVVTIPAQPEIH